ncbi:hypothetical protein [Labedaea rhizosphaerae]|uniref:Uncharacterized protein n=1 Tax=Labedaea rhizosphaerae TaxID=598644 RepID=A0A4R6RUH7_LABRH|nr:hypothetical protein [Labedaea rhizosphaerae]TDP90007.1 hypothetical protein EV186_111133 [Labedaea rhizosphaerae]
MEDAESVVVSVRHVVETGRAEEWFAAVCDAFDWCGGDWAVLKGLLATAAGERSFGSEVAETFVEFVEQHVADPMGVLTQLCERREELPRWYAELVGRLDQEAPAEHLEEWDDVTAAQWYTHLTTSNDWAGWAGGGAAEWAEFKEWFLYFAEQQQVRDYASLLLARVERDAGGYTAGFANLGIETAASAPEPEVAAGWGERTAARYAELTSGKGWGGWTGEDEHWDLFTQWFLYYAAEDGDHDDAAAFLAAVEASADKVNAFAEFGIAVAPRPAAAPGEATAASPVSAEELAQFGITEADLAAADRGFEALLGGPSTE